MTPARRADIFAQTVERSQAARRPVLVDRPSCTEGDYYRVLNSATSVLPSVVVIVTL